jgi:hypothetical protein
MITTIKTALETITGKKVSNYAIISLGNDFIKAVKALGNENLPAHFNEVKEKGTREDVKKGYTLLTEDDVIIYKGSSLFEGINKIYSAVEISKILKNKKTILVK